MKERPGATQLLDHWTKLKAFKDAVKVAMATTSAASPLRVVVPNGEDRRTLKVWQIDDQYSVKEGTNDPAVMPFEKLDPNVLRAIATAAFRNNSTVKNPRQLLFAFDREYGVSAPKRQVKSFDAQAKNRVY